MSDIVLSKGVRSNLLNLQRTADAIGLTQGRLATGKKVNSALDNPTNFFTASSLNSRANDLSNLLDGLSNGIKTLEAADNGLKAITKTVESMQSTLRQARQDKSFKGQSFTVGTGLTGGNISFSGGAVGTTAVDVALGSTAATNTTLNGAAAVSTSAFTGGNITINGTTATIRGDQAAVATTLTGRSATFGSVQGGTFSINGTNVTVRGDATAASNDRAASGGSNLGTDFDLSALDGETITLSSTNNANVTSTVSYTFTNSSTGQAAALETALETSGFSITRGANGISISRADGAAVTVTGSAPGVNTALGQANGTFNNGTEAFNATVSTVRADIDAALISGLTVSEDNGQLRLSLASGADISLGGTSGVLNSIGFDSGNRVSDNGSAAFDATAATVAADLNAAGVTGFTATDNAGTLNLVLSTGADLTLAGNDTLLTNIGFTTTRSSTNGTEAQVSTVDTIAAAINANSSLSGKVRASNDGGKLRIENLSTESLSVVGVDAAGVTGGTGSANTQSIGGNEVRKNLISQFNELRTQLDKLSDDASFNGINLLRGDKLSLNFNEGGTSKLDIQAKNANGDVRGISTADNSLDIDAVDADVMQSDANIDTRLAKLGDALTALRTQSSSFGSNLSVVQNRQEFTKATINTLKTGADNLTLADMNEEAANLLSLQTRQQLSNTALSLANQADQGVLRLF